LGYLIARKEKKRKEKKRKVIEAPKSFKRGARKGPFSFLNVDIYNIYIQEKKSHRGEALCWKIQEDAAFPFLFCNEITLWVISLQEKKKGGARKEKGAGRGG
jgi:hypothetical protein